MQTVINVAQEILEQRLALHKVEQEVERFLVDNYGLTFPQLAVLQAAETGTLQLGQVADQLGYSRGNVTGIADRLEEKGFVQREHSREDRRVVFIRLTDAGRDVLRRIRTETYSKSA